RRLADPGLHLRRPARDQPVRGAVRGRGVRLVADDLDWSFGRGPDVHGTAEALLLAMGGRTVVLDELSGPGRDRLARNLGALIR
ncbi:DinB family protein, partial [Tsukamurella tyrosinosolvens]